MFLLSFLSIMFQKYHNEDFSGTFLNIRLLTVSFLSTDRVRMREISMRMEQK
jgi:hypothetical protein